MCWQLLYVMGGALTFTETTLYAEFFILDLMTINKYRLWPHIRFASVVTEAVHLSWLIMAETMACVVYVISLETAQL